MAKKKQDDPPKGSPAWMATFSDLMNLLLCFFVLLFSMSSVDANKWEEVVASMTSAFSVFNEGSTSIGDGTLIGMGTTQLSNLDEYFSSMGQSATDKGEDPRDTSDQSGEGKTEDPQNGEGKTENPNDGEGSLEKQLEEANRKETETMLDSVSELTEIYNISGLLEVGMDPNGKYIELTINGSVLFDSGKAELKKECLPLLSKVGDILKVYAGHDVEVIGHTDNIPMKSSLYPNNDMLSSARAISAAHYLIEEKGVSVEHISWTGRGEYDPIDTNTTAEGRARNRRVEIRIYNSLNSTRTKEK
ncbi:MAG: flagellar motor protein MotB [Lachnospiraceae bacterium]|jgi:chemotaxis protein MotB|nr:flagellar motor protein MotB [Lachnospiraceae bacterium]MCR4993289.1 flagellar motor protein MotB [Lachnospiraceae bacterium]